MFGISGIEIAIIAIFALILFGPDKIPQMMKTVRKALDMYNEARTQVTDVVNTQILTPEDREMLKDPLGMNEMKDSFESLLTPERKSLISNSDPSTVTDQSMGASDSQFAPADSTPKTQKKNSKGSNAESIWASLDKDKGA